MLRRAFVLPILAAPPVQAIQALTLSQSKVGRDSTGKRSIGSKRETWVEYILKGRGEARKGSRRTGEQVRKWEKAGVE
jgi:hypothetical protein